MSNARPEIRSAVETMIKKGKWTVPGYRVSRPSPFHFSSGRRTVADDLPSQEKFGEFSLM